MFDTNITCRNLLYRWISVIKRRCQLPITFIRFVCFKSIIPPLLMLLLLGFYTLSKLGSFVETGKGRSADFRGDQHILHAPSLEFHVDIPVPPHINKFGSFSGPKEIKASKDDIIDQISAQTEEMPRYKDWQKLYRQQWENLFFLIGNPRSHLVTPLEIDKECPAYKDLIDLNLYQLAHIEKLKNDFLNFKMEALLVQYVQKVIEHNQNPSECNNIEVLYCDFSKGCGFGCQMHHLLYCFTVALGEGKPFLIKLESHRGFSTIHEVFKPLSDKCSLKMEIKHKLTPIRIPILEYNRENIYVPPVVPKQIYKYIEHFHSFPLLWWMGQLSAYMFRFQPDIMEQIKLKNFVTPIIGVHVRRTDKIELEAAFYKVEEYMFWVDLYNRKLDLQGKSQITNVYIATDGIGVINEFRKKYPNYTFISNEQGTADANMHRNERSGQLGILSDVYHLSLAEYLVCTFSSQVCRLAYEWMNYRHVDASNNFRSLDHTYFFGGSAPRDFNLILNHTDKNKFFDTKIKINLRHNDWNGYSGIQTLDTYESYHVPTFKLTENWRPVEFKCFSNYEKSKGRK